MKTQKMKRDNRKKFKVICFRKSVYPNCIPSRTGWSYFSLIIGTRGAHKLSFLAHRIYLDSGFRFHHGQEELLFFWHYSRQCNTRIESLGTLKSDAKNKHNELAILFGLIY